MTWPIPQPADIADRAAGVFEAEFPRIWALKNPGAPPASADARSPWSTLAVYARVLGLTGFDLWMFLARAAQELMPDTAVDWLPYHGQIWGVPRKQPVASAGYAVFQVAPTFIVPAGVTLSAPGGGLYVTTGTGGNSAGGAAAIAVAAGVAGSAGILPAATVLAVVSPLAGLTSQQAVVDSSGVTGGLDLEGLEVWRARILKRIRARGAGGSASDFVQWTQEVLPAALVQAYSPGPGLAVVAFAMPTGTGWRAPTATEVGLVASYANDTVNRKPLGAPVIAVQAATLTAVPVTIHISPDTAAIRAAAINALTILFQTGTTIGGGLAVSPLDAALANASGEVFHDRTAPASDIAGVPGTLLVLGAVTFA